jgi:hypothetical protein
VLQEWRERRLFSERGFHVVSASKPDDISHGHRHTLDRCSRMSFSKTAALRLPILRHRSRIDNLAA